MKNRSVFFVGLFCVFASTNAAWSQVSPSPSPYPAPAPLPGGAPIPLPSFLNHELIVQSAQRLSESANQFSAQLVYTPSAGNISDYARQFAQRADDFARSIQTHFNFYSFHTGFAQLRNEYRLLRRRVLQVLPQSQEPVLESWDRVVFASVQLESSVFGNGNPGLELSAVYFEGHFANIPVNFHALRVDDLYQQCRAWFAQWEKISPQDTGRIRNVSVFGNAYQTNSAFTFWSGDALCSIVALNARAAGWQPALRVRALLGETPIDIQAANIESLRDLARRYIPIAVAGKNVRVIRMEEAAVTGTFQTSGAFDFFSGNALATVISYSANPVGFAGGNFPVTARGTIQNAPFYFAGNSRQEIQAQCLDYVRNVYPQGVNRVNVNGVQRTSGSPFKNWSDQQTALLVSQMSSGGGFPLPGPVPVPHPGPVPHPVPGPVPHPHPTPIPVPGGGHNPIK